MERGDSSADEGLIVDDEETFKPKRRLAKAKAERREASEEEDGIDAAGKIAADDQEYDAEADRRAQDEEADQLMEEVDEVRADRRPADRSSNAGRSGGKKLKKGEIEPSILAVAAR